MTHGVASSGDFYTCNKVEELTVNDLSGISVKPLKIGSTVETLPLESFDVTRYAGKTLVFLVSATWCGYCKYDLKKTMEWRKRSGWPKNDIAVVHMLASSKKQNLQNAEAFLAKPMVQNSPLSLDGVDFYFSGEANFSDLKRMKGPSGGLLFPGLSGTPYAIIFDKDGVARFRGHYTGRSRDHGTYYDEHYRYIGKVASGQCASQ